MAARELFNDIASSSDLEPLTLGEIEDFFRDIDRDNDGTITFDELKAKLEEVHDEIAPEAQEHHLHHPDRRFLHPRTETHDIEKGRQHRGSEHDGLHAFLRAIMPDCSGSIGRAEFIRLVSSWNVPSQKL